MAADAWGYYDAGADDEQTKRDNEEAYSKYRLHPRVLRDVSAISTATTVLGQRMATPLGISPSAMHGLAHADGEIGMAQAAARHGGVMILSTFSSTAMEQVIAHSGGIQFWLQLYVFQDRQVSAALVRRAEAAGFKAIVLTVDAPELGRRLVDARNKFSPPAHIGLGNFDAEAGVKDGQTSEFAGRFSANIDRKLTWSNGVQWLRSLTALPIVLKGIMAAEDARLAVRHGCAGVIVSNHGGRQLDGTLATIDALPQVVQAVGGAIEVYLDSGVRRGTDIFKALALGARAVFVARPVLWGLAYAGADGAFLALDMLQRELVLAMTLAGTAAIGDIDESYVYCPAERWVRRQPALDGGPPRTLAAKL
ncbi:hypothetical protein H4R19_004040 [Coemansia spiralis]|nr:hypothetical protein H4R19_004040 [Coemansia spiralis]